MKRIFLTITLFSFFAVSPSVIFAQSSNDNDGDGIPNSEDACPNTVGTKANKGCPGNDEPVSTAIKSDNSRLTESDKKALVDCQFVFEDAGCAKFVGKTISEIKAIFGNSDSYGDYYRLGIHFWYYNDYKLEEITFQGVAPNDKYSPFVGKPGKKVDWNATIGETIAQYGNPSDRSQIGDYVDLKYGNVVFTFKFNKLVNAAIKDFATKVARENKTTPTSDKISTTSEKENLQLKNEKEFLALVKWDNENATSTNASIKRQLDYGNGIKQSPRITMAGIIRSLDAAIEGRKERIAKMETYLIGEKLPPQNIENARNLVKKIKDLNKDYEGYRMRYQNDLRNLR